MSLKRTIYRLSFHVFKLFSRAGIYILPAHYYVPIADVNRLEKTKEAWAVKSSLPGVYSNLDEQAGRLKEICLPFQKEYERNHIYKTAVSERSEEHTSELQSRGHLVCRLLLEKKNGDGSEAESHTDNAP